MADTVEKEQPVFKVKNHPGLPDGVISPEERIALKHNNPDLYEELIVTEKAWLKEQNAPEKPKPVVQEKPKAPAKPKAKAVIVKQTVSPPVSEEPVVTRAADVVVEEPKKDE